MNLLDLPSADLEASTSERTPAIGREAERRLRRSGYLALSDVACDASDGVLYLHGHLPTFYLKQVAQAIVARIEGVRHVINRIEVGAPVGRAPVGFDPSERPTNPSV